MTLEIFDTQSNLQTKYTPSIPAFNDAQLTFSPQIFEGRDLRGKIGNQSGSDGNTAVTKNCSGKSFSDPSPLKRPTRSRQIHHGDVGVVEVDGACVCMRARVCVCVRERDISVKTK